MVQGNYKPEFQKIYDIFNDQINSDYELGAGISIEYKGELIVDLFGGFKSESKTTKWKQNTKETSSLPISRQLRTIS